MKVMYLTIYFVDCVSCISIDCLHCYGYHHYEIETLLDAPYVPYDITSSIQRGKVNATIYKVTIYLCMEYLCVYCVLFLPFLVVFWMDRRQNTTYVSRSSYFGLDECTGLLQPDPAVEYYG